MEIGRYGSVGLELVMTILVPAAAGHWLDDRYWHHGGWGAGVGFLLGVAVGFRNLARTASGMQRDIERAEARDPEAGRWTVDESWLHGEVHGEVPGEVHGEVPGEVHGEVPDEPPRDPPSAAPPEEDLSTKGRR